LEVNPGKTETRRFLAATLVGAGRIDEAIQEYETVVAQRPDDAAALLALAWIRATDPDAARRDGAEAVRLAERARDLGEAPGLDRTLAAAYAEAGRFPDAVQACERAVERASAAGDQDGVARSRAQLSRYRAGQPYHGER
ncbi:MAG TPA: tetratricopeptide repeat protein, partial [Candidatus Eisenbacteria bacterium]